VYLATAYSMHFAKHASMDGSDDGLIVEVDRAAIAVEPVSRRGRHIASQGAHVLEERQPVHGKP